MQHIFRSLPDVFKDLDGNEAANEAVVFAAWRKISGESLGEHAVPLRLIKKKLLIGVSDNNWRRQLEDLSGQMIFKINSVVGSSLVTFIEFRINAKAVEEARRRNVSPETADVEARAIAKKAVSSSLRKAAEAIKDNKLRETFLIAAGSGLARKKQPRKS